MSTWTAEIRIDGVVKNIDFTTTSEWNARKMVHILCKGLREKGKRAVLLKFV